MVLSSHSLLRFWLKKKKKKKKKRTLSLFLSIVRNGVQCLASFSLPLLGHPSKPVLRYLPNLFSQENLSLLFYHAIAFNPQILSAKEPYHDRERFQDRARIQGREQLQSLLRALTAQFILPHSWPPEVLLSLP